ncbi:hypothetical protein PybrP1_012421 [[Pythium] brassicae (nom. inval.)]|nr:hypothetical protein PybrP1_012421 [[Pythium] brassicae (nom. inval.)]
MNGDDDFVTITAKHRKKQHAANGDVKGAADSKPPPPPAANASVSAGSSASPPPAAADSISLRPRTMFAMKGRGRAEAEGSAYRPQWSKDGEGFVTAGAAAAKDVHHDAQGAADAARRKAKVIRYTKEELLALHFTTTAPPEFPPETMVASELALPPVTTLPFDYEEIYEQWKLNRNRGGRGRGRGTSAQAEGGGGGGGGGQQQQQSDRSRSNGRWGEDDKWDKPATRDLSSMAEAAEKFRLEMDALRLELNAPVAVDLQKENNGDLDEFDKKLEVAAAAGQFEDSDEEDAQWDEPTDVGAGGGGGSGVVDEWFYLDPQGNQQGPFKSVEMREWFEAGYFKPHLPIRFGGDGQFTALASHFVVGQTPFAAPLPQPSPSIGAALGIFGGEQDRGIPTTEGFHNVMQPQFQSEFRTQHHLGAHDPALRDALFLNDGGARQQNEFWGQGAAAAAGAPAPTPASAASSSSLHQIQNEEKRKAADSVRQSPAKAAPRVAPTAPTSKPQQQPQPQQQAPAAPAAAPATSNATKKAQKPKAKAAAATAAAPTEAAKAVWVDPSAAPTKSLQQIQQEEQRELRRRMEDTVGGANLEQMGAQLKMMLGVQPSAASGAGSGASPWGVPPATAQPTQAAKQQSLRDILAEEERLAQERAKQSQSTSSAGSHWVNVVAGTTPAPAPKPSRALGPVPVSVLKSRPQVRATNGAEPSAAGGAKPVGGPTPPKSESDASFWNFGAAQTAKAAANASSLLSSSSSSLLSSGGATMSNAFGGSAGVSSEFMAWAAKQYQLISGRDDLTLVEYCVSLEDPGEIREYLAAYLGSTPRVSAFATEFIQRKKKGPSLSGAALKRSPSSSSKVSTDDDTAAGGAKKSGGKRRGGKGQKIDPSLLNFA